MTTGIDLVLADHRRVEALFDRFEAAPDATVAGEIVDALAAHDQAEHAALYPLVGVVLADESVVERAAQAHSSVKQRIEELMGVEGPALVEAVGLLQRAVVEHVQDEETNILPALAEAAEPGQLEGLAVRFQLAKQRVG